MKNRTQPHRPQPRRSSDAPPPPGQRSPSAAASFWLHREHFPICYRCTTIWVLKGRRRRSERRRSDTEPTPDAPSRAVQRRGASLLQISVAADVSRPTGARHLLGLASARPRLAPENGIFSFLLFLDIILMCSRESLVLGPFRTQWRSPFQISTHRNSCINY